MDQPGQGLHVRCWFEERGEPAADLARAWFATAQSRLPEGLWDLAVAVADARDPTDIASLPLPKAVVYSYRSGTYVDARRVTGAVERALRQFDNEVEEVAATFDILLPSGRRGSGSAFGAALEAHVPGWMHLRARAMHPPSPFASGADASWLVATLDEFLATHSPAYAVITPSNSVALEEKQAIPSDLTTPTCRTLLRSYEWVNVVSPELAQRLGGVEALRATGAFWRVSEVAGGAVWLQATEDFADYDRHRVEAVFEALRPVLPRRPLRPVSYQPSPWILYDRVGDADDIALAT